MVDKSLDIPNYLAFEVLNIAKHEGIGYRAALITIDNGIIWSQVYEYIDNGKRLDLNFTMEQVNSLFSGNDSIKFALMLRDLVKVRLSGDGRHLMVC